MVAENPVGRPLAGQYGKQRLAHHADHLSVPRGWECRDVRAVATIGTGARRLSA